MLTNVDVYYEDHDAFDWLFNDDDDDDDDCLKTNALVSKRTPKSVKLFDAIEDAGTEISYRCIDCRNCQNCKKSARIDAISIQEEIEQDIIEKGVSVDLTVAASTSTLPFIMDPDTRLTPNDKMARSIYNGQIRALANNPEDRDVVLKTERSWHDLGFVEYLDNLPIEDQDMILRAPVKYTIPWRVVWNENSKTTPCRIVLDASACPRGGCSLNSILAKGSNNMNKLIELMIRWLIHRYAYHTDITKCYNSVRLHKSHWKYHLYLWSESLTADCIPQLKVLKTFIYGVKPSGNVSECAIRKTAELTKEECPKAYDPIHNYTYVDDCASGEHTEEERRVTADQLSLALSKGGFNLKGFTFSGEDPPSHLSNDGQSIMIGGLKWYSREDCFSINLPDQLNFSKRRRGRKSDITQGIIPHKLTRRDCASKVAEIYDPLGRLTPITSGMKIDINQLTLRKLDWDDEIPESLRGVWSSHFEMMQEIGSIRFKRAVIPEDAIDTCIETIDAGDASQTMMCVAIYGCFRRKSGGHSSQLVFARSKVVPKDMTLPRAELLAASINASTGFVVQKAFGDRFRKCLKLTDSQVALHWINCKRTKLRPYVRNRSIECNRLTDLADWRYVESKDNIADIGTRKGVKLVDIGPDSEWINGKQWMLGDESEFPLKTISDIVLTNDSQREARKEYIILDSIDDAYFFNHIHVPVQHVPDDVGLRYEFSQYILDPNKYRFRKSVRVLGLVFLYIAKFMRKWGKRDFSRVRDDDTTNIPDILQHDKYIVTTGAPTGTVVCPAGLVIDLTENAVKAAMRYYFEKASAEIKHFLPESKYNRISEEVEGVLYYSGRILPSQEISGQISLSDVAFDLSKTTFCVPLIDKFSPIAYAIANEIHWYHPDVRHAGIESMLRQCNCVGYVIGGRKLVKDLKKASIRCRILRKKAVKVMMGPKHESNLCIAPAFHTTQVDICGPFDSFSNANKRARIKVWVVVFCCSTVGAIDCKVMEDYSTDSFILAFIRFSCRYGYPKNLHPDYGSQLLKGCRDMVLSYADMKHKLNVEYGVNFEACPVGLHYVHGKVERKIQQIKMSLEKSLNNNRLSIIQWESLVQQVANTINNLPTGLGNYTECLENMDLITPNRLLLGRNNDRGPTCPLELSHDVKKIIQTNSDIFKIWFKSWLVSYVPHIMDRPKWFENDRRRNLILNISTVL